MSLDSEEVKLPRPNLKYAVLELPFPPDKRIPKNADDFGDEGTVGLCLKKRGKSFTELDIMEDFAYFDGADDYHKPMYWFVSVFGIDGKVLKTLSYVTLEGLKKVWVLD